MDKTLARNIRSVGIIGFGAFGQLIARHIGPYFKVYAHDPVPPQADAHAIRATLEVTAACDVVVLATPVSTYADVAKQIAPLCKPGALVIDVGSVKVEPADVMRRFLPDHANIVATHPLFGPESARGGIKGLKIALCPIRGSQHHALAAFLRRKLNLLVYITTPEEHDQEAATVQGLTHLIAKVLSDMGPLPTRMTTKSFDLLTEAISMVQHDAPEVFDAIENANPYAPDVRRRFFRLASELSAKLEGGKK